MRYLKLVEVYEDLSKTTKKLEKVEILAAFLRDLEKEGKSEWIYLLQGRVVPEYDVREFGISGQLVIKALVKAYGVQNDEVVRKVREVGDLGEIASYFGEKKKQRALFSKKLDVDHVFSSLKKLFDMEGKGSVDQKMSLISELLLSAEPREAKYIVRTLLGDLRVGVADASIRDSIRRVFFSEVPEEKNKEIKSRIEMVYDLINDSVAIFAAASKGEKALGKLKIVPGRSLKVMLPVKVATIEEAFEVCGKPAAFEHKYDGFRVLIHKDLKGKISLFTRKLENVTLQFPDVVKSVSEGVKGKSFILDSEVVGFDSKLRKYMPFEAISQRIRRKYDIEKLTKELPVEVNVFDVLYLDGESVLDEGFNERRKIVEKIIKTKEWVIRPSVQFVTSDVDKAQKFYDEALEIGEEGVMIKRIDAPYKSGRYVGHIAKLKPVAADLDLVIVGAEYGTGKRGGWLTSYIVACLDKVKKVYVEVGKVSSGLKEKEEEGMTYDEMTKLLKPLIKNSEGNYVSLTPKVVIAVTYQNIQESPSYSSGYALRFPRITAYRPDKPVSEISTLKNIEREIGKQR